MNAVKITFPSPLSVESWKLILEQKPVLEVWVEGERQKYPMKWDGSQLSEPVEMWFTFPDFIVVSSRKSDSLRSTGQSGDGSGGGEEEADEDCPSGRS